MPVVIVQKWEESERGWGCRPDGYSIHRTEEDRAAYVEGFLTTQRRLLGERVPDEYDRPCGTPYSAEVSTEDHEALDGKDGVRFYKHERRGYPGDGGPDGWRVRTGRSSSGE